MNKASMKKIYFTLVVLFSVAVLNAQQLITVPNDSSEITDVVTDGFQPYDVHIGLINNSGSPVTISWGLMNYTAPGSWEVKLCDNNNCYDLLLAPGPHVSLQVQAGDTMDMKFQYTSHCNTGFASSNVYAYINGDSINSVVFLNYRATLTANCLSGVADNTPVRLKIYPNPVHGSFVVTGLEDAGNLSFEVYDMKGETVKSEIKNASDTQIEISLQNLSKGNYILKAFDADGKAAGTSRLTKVD